MIFAVFMYIAHLETDHTSLKTNKFGGKNFFSFFKEFLLIFIGRRAHLSVGLEDLFKSREMNGIDIIFHHKFHQHHCVASFSGEK